MTREDLIELLKEYKENVRIDEEEPEDGSQNGEE